VGPSVIADTCSVTIGLLKLQVFCGCRGDCAEFFAKHLKSQVHKQLRLLQPQQQSDTKPVHLASSSLTTPSASLSPDCLAPTASLVSVFPPLTHDSSLPSPSDLLIQLKVLFVTAVKYGCFWAFKTCLLEYIGW